MGAIMFRRRKPAPKPARYVKIMAQVYDHWTFQIEAPADEAYVCLTDWIRITRETGQDEPEPTRPTRQAGFAPARPSDPTTPPYRASDG